MKAYIRTLVSWEVIQTVGLSISKKNVFQNSLTDLYSAAYTRILVRDATRLSPKLLLMMQANSAFTTASMITVRDVQYPSITDNSLNLTVILDPTTHLPYLIRTYEDHHIFGKSSNDFVVYNYTAVGGVQIPRRIKVYYNDQHMLLDTIYDNIEINPSFGSGYFDGIPTAQVANTELGLMPSPATAEAEYGDAEVFENTLVMLCYDLTYNI
jgi:hypothetical protein